MAVSLSHAAAEQGADSVVLLVIAGLVLGLALVGLGIGWDAIAAHAGSLSGA